jgi:hypothetical protein
VTEPGPFTMGSLVADKLMGLPSQTLLSRLSPSCVTRALAGVLSGLMSRTFSCLQGDKVFQPGPY